MSPALESCGLMKKPCSILQCNVLCSPECGASGVSSRCYVHPTLTELNLPSVLLPEIALFACSEQSLVPVLLVVQSGATH